MNTRAASPRRRLTRSTSCGCSLRTRLDQRRTASPSWHRTRQRGVRDPRRLCRPVVRAGNQLEPTGGSPGTHGPGPAGACRCPLPPRRDDPGRLGRVRIARVSTSAGTCSATPRRPPISPWYLDQSVPRFAGSAEVRAGRRGSWSTASATSWGSRPRAPTTTSTRCGPPPTGQHFIVWTMDATRAVARVGAGVAHPRPPAGVDRRRQRRAADVPLCRVRRGERAAAERGCGASPARPRHVRLRHRRRVVGSDRAGRVGRARRTTRWCRVLRPASALADATVALLQLPPRRR